LDTILSSKADLLWQVRGDELILGLPATLDESFSFGTVRPKLSQVVVLDCSAVNHVSSAWASKWINWHRSLHPEQQFVFRQCPRKFIDMINFIDGFLPENSTVASFVAPFECQLCHHESPEMMVRGRHFVESVSGEPPITRIPFRLNCDRCPGTMEFAVLEKTYLRFLNFADTKKRRQVP